LYQGGTDDILDDLEIASDEEIYLDLDIDLD